MKPKIDLASFKKLTHRKKFLVGTARAIVIDPQFALGLIDRIEELENLIKQKRTVQDSVNSTMDGDSLGIGF